MNVPFVNNIIMSSLFGTQIERRSFLMSSSATILISLSVALLSGLLLSRLAKLVRLPAITAYLLAGVLIGPYILGAINIPGLGIAHSQIINDRHKTSQHGKPFINRAILGIYNQPPDNYLLVHKRRMSRFLEARYYIVVIACQCLGYFFHVGHMQPKYFTVGQSIHNPQMSFAISFLVFETFCNIWS